mgnify:CR=1 FL=1
MKNDAWNQLFEFESKDLLQQYFKDVYALEAMDWKVREISSNVIQAREYFRSTRLADISVKPLLLYYGVLSLSRALVLVLNPKKRECTLKASHGLSISNWSETIESRNFQKLRVVIGTGSFSETVIATENQMYFRFRSSAREFKAGLTIPPSGTEVDLEKVFMYLPDLYEEYQLWTGSQLPFGLLEGSERIGDFLKFSLYKRNATRELAEQIFPVEYCKERQIEDNGETIKIKFKDEGTWGPNYAQKWYGVFDMPELCVVPVLGNDIGFTSLSAMFLVSYVLGMMVRYYPTTWISIGSVQKGDRIFPLINRTLQLIEHKYPEIVLDYLQGKRAQAILA